MTITQNFQKKVKEKNNVLEYARKLFDARDEIINLFEKGIFPYKDNAFKTKEEELEENKLKKVKDDNKKFFKSIDINFDLLKDHFVFVAPTVMAKKNMRQKIKRKTMS